MSGVLTGALSSCTISAAILVLILGNAAASSVIDERNHGLVRREKQIELHMQLYATPDDDANAADGGDAAASGGDAAASGGDATTATDDDSANATATAPHTGMKISEMCDDDYPQGVDGEAFCTGDMENITEPERCFQAADEANVTHPLASEIVGSSWQNRRPKGCFSFPCSEDSKGTCYFFNPVLGQPEPTKLIPAVDAIAGRPVCRRPKLLNGTRHLGTATFTDGGCPTGYQVIKGESNCLEAARCLGLPQASDFKVAVANLSAYHDYPEGCFIFDHPDLAETPPRVYFNAPLNDTIASDIGKPARPIGTPICNVSTITMYPPGGPVESNLHLHAIAMHDSIGSHDQKVSDTNYTGR